MKNFLTIILFFSALNLSNACDCITSPIESHIIKSNFIFTGKVLEVLDNLESGRFMDTSENKDFFKDKGYSVRVLVIQKLKTSEFISDTLEFTSDYTNCDPIYKLNESYLFFAEKADSEKFKMSHCTYWSTLDQAKDNINIVKTQLEKINR